jgi:putative protein-disulfide isomerase
MPPHLHYIFDPFCGWCYAVAPLIRVVRERDIMPIVLHCGGMTTGERRQPVTPAFRDFVISHERRMEALSGQPFGDAYRNGLLCDERFVYDSEPPSIAILAADALAGRGLDMMLALQQAHYVDGRNTTAPSVLAYVAAEIGLDHEAFKTQLVVETAKVTEHFAQSRQWLARVGGQGYPTFAIERGGEFHRIETGPWLGKPEAFATEVTKD